MFESLFRIFENQKTKKTVRREFLTAHPLEVNNETYLTAVYAKYLKFLKSLKKFQINSGSTFFKDLKDGFRKPTVKLIGTQVV